MMQVISLLLLNISKIHHSVKAIPFFVEQQCYRLPGGKLYHTHTHTYTLVTHHITDILLAEYK